MSKKIYKNILFNQDRDRVILEFLDSQDNQSGTVRNALRLYMNQAPSSCEITLEDVMAKINELSRQLASIKMVSGGAGKEDEPQDVVNKLKNFGKF